MIKDNETSPVVLITGASSGIGAASAQLFAAQGYTVVLAARRGELLERLAERILLQGGNALAITTDVTRWEDVQK